MPVRWRLTLAFAAVMAVVLVATGAFIHGRLASNLDQAVDRTLRARAADVAALAQQADNGLRSARYATRRQGIDLAQLVDSQGRVIDRTPELTSRAMIGAAALASVRREQRPVLTEVLLHGYGTVRVLAEPVDAQGERMVVLVGQSLADRNRALDNLTGVLILGGPIVLALASAAGYLLTGAALRPVELMRRRATSISAANLDERLPSAGGNDELGRLGRTLNEMLARLHVSLARERAFTGDASHELRSPLAMLRTELELILRDRPAGIELDTAVGSAIEETDRLSQLVDDLLLLARADEQQLAVNLAETGVISLLSDAAQRARRIAPHLEIVVDAPTDVWVAVDRSLIARAIDNLLANALRFARKQVRLTAGLRGGVVELHVVDDGPGLPPAFLPQAWERFARADSARSEGGSGLGLAIVRTIAEAHGGQARLANRSPSGADASISLPIAARAPHMSGHRGERRDGIPSART